MVVGPFFLYGGIPMNQQELNSAIAKITNESIGTIEDLGFSLLSLPPSHPLYTNSRRRQYPLRLAHEDRKRKPPRRKSPPKSSTPSMPVIRPVAKHSDNDTDIRTIPSMRLTFFDRGA